MKPKSSRNINHEIITRLDLLAVYRELGVEICGEPRASGFCACRAVGREDRGPSAWFNVQTGYFGDSGGKDSASYTMSLFDFAVRHGGGRYGNDWREARKIFAERAGVTIAEPAADSNGKKRKADSDRWRDRLEFQDWTAPGATAVAQRWCLKVKPGVTVEAIQSAGGRLAYYPCFRDESTGTLQRRKWAVQVIAVPAYGADLLAADPVAWVIWDATGAGLRLPGRKGQPDREPAKMLSIGPTAGAMMGLHGLMILADEERRAKVSIAWKTGGPTDMLALWSVIPAERKESDIVVTNASGENGEVLPYQARLLAGLPVAVIHDCDDAGEAGRLKWSNALAGVAAERRHVRLPWPVKRSHGEDIRDWILGKEIES